MTQLGVWIGVGQLAALIKGIIKAQAKCYQTVSGVSNASVL